MDLSQLEAFLAVAEERGFSRAALKLNRSQPAVSQVIRKLEDDLGEVLFERASRDGSLTAAGELLREYAKRLLSLRSEASSALEELRSLERGRLQLAANEYTCLYLLPILDEFRRLCPQVRGDGARSLASRIPDGVAAENSRDRHRVISAQGAGLPLDLGLHRRIDLCSKPQPSTGRREACFHPRSRG